MLRNELKEHLYYYLDNNMGETFSQGWLECELDNYMFEHYPHFENYKPLIESVAEDVYNEQF